MRARGGPQTPALQTPDGCRYLGETFGVDAGLYPGPGPKRGNAMKWIVWSNVTLAEAVFRLMQATNGCKPGEAFSVLVVGSSQRVSKFDSACPETCRCADGIRCDVTNSTV